MTLEKLNNLPATLFCKKLTATMLSITNRMGLMLPAGVISRIIIFLIFLTVNLNAGAYNNHDSLFRCYLQYVHQKDTVHFDQKLSLAVALSDFDTAFALKVADDAKEEIGNDECRNHNLIIVKSLIAFKGANYSQAISGFNEALNFTTGLDENNTCRLLISSDSLKMLLAMSSAYYGDIYSANQRFTSILQSINKADTSRRSVIMLSWADAAQNHADQRELIQRYDSVVLLAVSIKNTDIKVRALLGKATVFEKRGDFAKALNCLNEAELSSDALNINLLANLYAALASTNSKRNSFTAAGKYWSKFLETALLLPGRPIPDEQILLSIEQLHNNQEYEMALQLSSLHRHVLENRLNNLKTDRQQERAMVLQLTTGSAIQTTTSSTHFSEHPFMSFPLITAIIGSLLLILVILFLRNKKSTRLLTNQNKEIKLQQEEIKRQNEKLARTNRNMQEAKEKAEEATQSKSLFLANMSHEIRTPIHGIIGMINSLCGPNLNARQQDALNDIVNSAENLVTIINEILDFSKIESGRLDLENISFDLHAEIANGVKLLRMKANEKNLQLSFGISPFVPRFVSGDPVRLKQILINLVNNGIKFTEKGSVKVNVSVDDRVGHESVIRFEITDTGIGINEEGLNKLFQTFSQADITFTRRFGGTGLGLAISKNLVERMRGHIGVESRIGVGSTFWFTVTLSDGQEMITPQERTENTTTEPSSDQSKKNLSVLLAEDNLVNQKVAMMVIQKLGHHVDVAVNGRVAVEKFLSNRYDLILMDMMMPELDGLDATIEIRKKEKELGTDQPIKIVALTANAMKEDRERCMDAGMDDYLSKPFKPEDLQRIIG